MDINGLRYFIKVAETMNFTKAASECAITQTAMSQHIRNMEKSLGFKLFERSTRQVTLTPAGENFYKKAQVIVEEFDEAVSSSKDIVKGKSGSIRACVASTVEGMMLMPRFAAFKEQNPNISLGLTIITPSQIPREIIKGRCDIAVYCPTEFNSSLLQIRRIADFDYVILCSRQHRFSALERISLKELQKEKILTVSLLDSPHERLQTAKQFLEHGLMMPETLPPCRINSIQELLLQISLYPECVAIVPVFVRPFIPPTHCIIDIEEQFYLTISSAIQKNPSNPAVRLLAQFLSDSRIPLRY